MVISACIWQGGKVNKCEEEFFPLAVYITLASYMAGASLKAKLGNHGHFMFSKQSVHHFRVIVVL